LRATWIATFAASAAAAASYGRWAPSGSAASTSSRSWLLRNDHLLAHHLRADAGADRPSGEVLAFRDLSMPKRGRVVGWLAGPFAQLIVKRPLIPVLVTVALAGASVYAGYLFAQEPIQYDFTKLGSRFSEQRGQGYWDRHVDAVLQSYQTPTVVLTGSPEHAERWPTPSRRRRSAKGRTAPSSRW